MGTGYVRNDTSNNIADGNVINASDLDGEFDAVQAAFNASTGHSHDGTTGEGPQLTTAGLADDAVTGAKIDSTTTVTAASFVGPLTGNASTATTLQTARTIAGQSFNGSANISIAPTDLTSVTSTASEINILDGATVTTAELNKLDGFTGTVADLNYAKDLNATGVTTTEFDKLDGLTASTAELNILDGVTATATEINKIDGYTCSTAELNILDGVTATTAELNIMDGVTATTAELNYVDGVTSNIQTQLDAKGNVSALSDLGVTATAAELNKLDNVTTSATEFNILDGDTSATSTTLVDADRAVVNDNGTMVQVALTDFGTYFKTNVTTLGTIEASKVVTADSSGEVQMPDDKKLYFGTDDDAHIMYDETTDDRLEIGGAEVYVDNTLRAKRGIGATLTDTTNTGNITLDFATYQNFVLTLTGNVTLVNPTTEAVGQSGFIVLIQDGTGGRTLSLGTDYETAAGGGITLSTTASTTDIVPYIVAASGRILLGAPQLAFS